MNLTAIIRLKEKIAISPEFSAKERDFTLDAINEAIERAKYAVIVFPRGSMWKAEMVEEGPEHSRVRIADARSPVNGEIIRFVNTEITKAVT